MKTLHIGLLTVLGLGLAGCSESEDNKTKEEVPEAASTTVADAPVTGSMAKLVTLPTLSSQQPFNIGPPSSNTLEEIQEVFDEFSWQMFVALNWPANNDGSPNTNATIGTDDSALSVWQHYKDSSDIFLPGGATPTGWGQPTEPPAICTGGTGAPVLSQVGKTFDVLTASTEPFLTGPLIDQHGQYTRFAILTNEEMFDYILNNTLYSKDGQTAFGKEADFPESTASSQGAVMIKSAWKIMDPSDDQTRFRTASSYVYDPAPKGGDATCTLQTVGLVGFHVATKMQGNSQWIWSTFEHVDNAPTANALPPTSSQKHYNYYDPECASCQVNQPPDRPWNPGVPASQHTQVVRVIPIAAKTAAVTVSYQAALRAVTMNNVFANYELVSTQWPTNSGSATDKTGVPAPSFLANTTLETYIQGTVPQTSSSCIQCHLNATMTTGEQSDFTYLLQRAQ